MTAKTTASVERKNVKEPGPGLIGLLAAVLSRNLASEFEKNLRDDLKKSPKPKRKCLDGTGLMTLKKSRSETFNQKGENMGDIRTFKTGATRDKDTGKYDYEGFLSPLVLQRFAQYMNKHRYQSDGMVRDSDNWQKGIPKKEYMKSGWRHFMDWWLEYRGFSSREGLQDALCALMFNVMGYLHEDLKERGDK